MSKIPNKDERIRSEQVHIENMKQVIAFCEQSIKTSEETIGRLTESAKLPDDVRDVPQAITGVEFADSGKTYKRYRVSNGKIFGEYTTSANKTSDIYFFMTERFAMIFKERTELIAKCLWFKWLYDREYVPDWNNDCCDKWYVYKEFSCSLSPNNYICGFEDTCDCNHVYFSTKEIAEKCAEWLDMLEKEKNEA